MEHSRFDPAHVAICDDCRDAYEDFVHESNVDAELDALSEEADPDEQ